MERQSPPPPKPARPSHAELGTAALPAPRVALGLGLGPSVGAGTERTAFTFLQLQELQHQALIYKYMEAGMPVPLQLILPIWKSVAGSSPSSSSSSSSHFRGHHPLPSFMGCVGGGLCFDYGSGVDPEPGRCRRTDGKKWRCSRDAVPNQKYCERHMHRGRHRSRKPVESGVGGSTASPTAPSQPPPPGPATVDAASTHLSMAVPTGLQLMPTNAGGGSSSSSGVSSPHTLGFSPISVLQLRAGT